MRELANDHLTTCRPGSERIRAALIEIFEDLSGLSLAESDSATSFLEMGFDSLFLTQVTQALQAKFALKITFRQLLDRESTLESLSAFVESNLPAESFPAAPVFRPAADAAPGVSELPKLSDRDARPQASLPRSRSPVSHRRDRQPSRRSSANNFRQCPSSCPDS